MEYLKVQSWDLFFFLLYNDDFPNASNFETILFADDTNLHLSHININSPQSRVQQEMMKVSKWMISNKLTLNYKRSCYMLISKKLLNDSNFFQVLINQNLIEKSECVKYLGVYVDNKLSWRTHTQLKILRCRYVTATLAFCGDHIAK